MTQRTSGALFQLHLAAAMAPRASACGSAPCALTTWLRAALWLHQTGVIINFIINFGVFDQSNV